MCCGRFVAAPIQTLQTQGFVDIIPRQTYLNDATYGDFVFYKCINSKKFYDALGTVRIDNATTLKDKIRTNEDIRKLAYYADNGIDMQKWSVSVKRLLKSISFDQEELDNAKCRVEFSNDSKK